MATFPWEYRARNGTNLEPGSFSKSLVIIGLNGDIPTGMEPDESTFVIHIDPKLDDSHSSSSGTLGTDWGDVLRLPTEGGQDHQYIISTRRMETTWVANEKLFPTIYDFMIAVSQHARTSKYVLVRKHARAHAHAHDHTPDSEWRVSKTTDYHPMSGQMPPKSDDDAENLRLLTIILGVIWQTIQYENCDIGQAAPAICKNNYSVFSTSLSPVILLVSYYDLQLSGPGTVQDKFGYSADYRRAIASRMRDVAESYLAVTGSTKAAECARKMRSHLIGKD